MQTAGIHQTLDPADWRRHRFGLPPERWAALADRTAWVTGAGTGFGQAVAVALAAAGARVYLSARRADKLEATRALTATLGIDPGGMTAVTTDITDAAALDAATTAMTGLDTLVHCAALPQWPGGQPLLSGPESRWRALIDTNLTGTWLVTRAALRAMAPEQRCRMVLFSSEAGWADTPGMGPYDVSKAAVNSLGFNLAAEAAATWPGRDIQINVLVPGEARSEMNQGSAESPFTAVPMTLLLLSHPAAGPNGRFFHRDGRHLDFAYSRAYPHDLLNRTSGAKPSWWHGWRR